MCLAERRGEVLEKLRLDRVVFRRNRHPRTHATLLLGPVRHGTDELSEPRDVELAPPLTSRRTAALTRRRVDGHRHTARAFRNCRRSRSRSEHDPANQQRYSRETLRLRRMAPPTRRPAVRPPPAILALGPDNRKGNLSTGYPNTQSSHHALEQLGRRHRGRQGPGCGGGRGVKTCLATSTTHKPATRLKDPVSWLRATIPTTSTTSCSEYP